MYHKYIYEYTYVYTYIQTCVVSCCWRNNLITNVRCKRWPTHRKERCKNFIWLVVLQNALQMYILNVYTLHKLSIFAYLCACMYMHAYLLGTSTVDGWCTRECQFRLNFRSFNVGMSHAVFQFKPKL